MFRALLIVPLALVATTCPDGSERDIRTIEGAARFESAHLGFAATPSQVHAAYVAVRRSAPHVALLRLASHPNPVARAYGYVALLDRGALDEVRLNEALGDSERLLEQRGCMLTEATVGQIVSDAAEQSFRGI